MPYILYPYVSIEHGAANGSMALALIIAFIAGFLLLLPSLLFLMRLFIFDKGYVKGKK